MERPLESSGKPVRAQRLLAGLILLPGLIVAGLAYCNAVLLCGLHGQIIELRESLDGLPSQVRMVKARTDLLNAEIALVRSLGRTRDPAPGWERVLASVPPEATTGRVVFCTEGSEVTIHGRRADEALLVLVASELQGNADMQRVELSGQGSDDIMLTIVPKLLAASAEASP